MKRLHRSRTDGDPARADGAEVEAEQVALDVGDGLSDPLLASVGGLEQRPENVVEEPLPAAIEAGVKARPKSPPSARAKSPSETTRFG